MKTTLKGPRGRLFFGSAADFKRDQLGFYVSCAREYGDWVETWLGPFRMWLVYHPDAIEEILVTRSRDFAKSSGLLRLRPLGGNGLFLAEGDPWLRQRRLLQPAFHRQRLAGYGEVMTAFARRHTADWKDGRVVEMQSEMMALTQAIVAKTLFDADMSGDAYEAGQAAEMVKRDFGDRLQRLLVPPYWLPTPRNLKLRRAIRRLDRLVYRIIEERRSSPRDRGDLLSMLVEAQDADDGSRMTVQQVRDEVMTLFMGARRPPARHGPLTSPQGRQDGRQRSDYLSKTAARAMMASVLSGTSRRWHWLLGRSASESGRLRQRTGRACKSQLPFMGSSICRRSWCEAGAKGRRCTAYHPDMGVMRTRRQIALGSLGPAEFVPSRDS